MGEQVQNCCRICLDAKPNHVSIFEDPTIHLHLRSCLSLTISPNDYLTKKICPTCVSQLQEFYNFQLNARCSQDWLESTMQEKSKKSTETKTQILPLPDSEYNSDSLLEFLNNTANIEEYLNNLGKDDIPSLVNMFDKNNDNSMEAIKLNKPIKQCSPKKKETKTRNANMQVDVLDTDVDIVKGLLMKETEPKCKSNLVIKVDKKIHNCFACKIKFESINKLSQHLIICDLALRTCVYCNEVFNSRLKMQEHSIMHNSYSSLTCLCGKRFESKDKLTHHHKVCHVDYVALQGCVFRCKQCGDTFKERFQLYKHAKEHVAKAEERICDICGQSFIGDETLNKHRQEEHGRTANQMYRCKICSFTSPNHKEMYIHVQKHTSKPPSNLHLCESCGRSFVTHATLMRHSVQHQHNTRYMCTVCNKLFVNENLRDLHLLRHMEVVICERCGQSVNSGMLPAHCCG